jgi:hypothetical protein
MKNVWIIGIILLVLRASFVSGINGNQYNPYADFTWTPEYPYQREMIYFNASESYDPDGYIILYEWDWNNDGIYDESHTDPTGAFSWSEHGDYPVTLRITDNDNTTDTKIGLVTIHTHKPNKTFIQGKTNGTAGNSYLYTFVASDPDGDDIFYTILWGDHHDPYQVDIGPYFSGTEAKLAHTYSEKGNYTIWARAEDANGAIGEWSTLDVTMPCSYSLSFMQFWERLFERFPNAFPILRHLMGY